MAVKIAFQNQLIQLLLMQATKEVGTSLQGFHINFRRNFLFIVIFVQFYVICHKVATISNLVNSVFLWSQ